MLYYISQILWDDFTILNVFSYHTVRSGGAMVTAFLVSLFIGPKVLDFLRALKVGQFIKKDHVEDLHEKHKSKAGTPTMGGLLIVISTLISLGLWSTWTNRLFLIAVCVLFSMGMVGFLDDYIKLRRKHNDGLSARAKFGGQFLVGIVLGVFLVMKPIASGPGTFSTDDILDWGRFAFMMETSDSPMWSHEKNSLQNLMARDDFETDLGIDLSFSEKLEMLEKLNSSLIVFEAIEEKIYRETEVERLINDYRENESPLIHSRLNRIMLEQMFPKVLKRSHRDIHTKVAVPGFKDRMIPLGWMYVPFVIFILVGTSNGVNLTDGLDGLAAGASVVSIAAFTALAYVVSRADWSSYLFVTYIPEASELTVFGAALLGAGMGFLWFNAHPAEVFMGDTGSLALGGVLGAMAILTKQELLLPIVGGLFVIETLSVILQVGSFKLRGKRVFRMAPIHHHFELLGWSETKVTIRFWILALMFALMSLATLKLR
jgi:phospho-N-acetylmuramoyl-pentapeptide-transferase